MRDQGSGSPILGPSARELVVLVTSLVGGVLTLMDFDRYWPLGVIVLGIGVARWRDAGVENETAEQAAAAVFEDPREALLELVECVVDPQNGTIYEFAVIGSDRIWEHIVNPGGVGPLFLDPDQRIVLALYHRTRADYFVILSEDLDQLRDPEFTADELRSRFAVDQAGGPLGGVAEASTAGLAADASATGSPSAPW